MKNQTDVIVAGVGSMGAAACCHLASRGAKVLGLEAAAEVPHTRGSHHGRSRMIRQSYYEHPDYVPLLRRAYELWEDLERESDREGEILHLTGGLYMGEPTGSIVPGALTAAREHALPHELIEDPAVLRARFPAFRISDSWSGFYEEKAGYVVPEEAVRAYAQRALAHGATLRMNERILAWRSGPGGIDVRTDRGRYEADHLVITAGAWSREFAQRCGVELHVTRQVLAWFRPEEGQAVDRFALGNLPCWFIENDSPYGHYGFPVSPEFEGVKIALHRPGERIAPDDLAVPQKQPREEEVEGLRSVLHTFIPGAGGDLLEATTCLYTNSPDGHFILGPYPGEERVTLACGFSGHGFKFASVMGEVLADLATEGATEQPIGFLRPGRFES